MSDSPAVIWDDAKQTAGPPQVKWDQPAIINKPVTPTIGPGEPGRNGFPGTGKYRAPNPVQGWLDEAENLTQEGAKEHPVQNFIGQTAKRGREWANIVGTMGSLFMGPEGMTPAAGAHELPLPEPIAAKQLPAAKSIQAPVSSLEPRVSMREQLGSTLPGEPVAKVAASPTAAAGPVGQTAPIAEPRPQVVTGQTTPPSTRSLLNRLGQQIEDVAKRPGVEPTARAVPPGSVGAKAVGQMPNDILPGPAIQTPSRTSKLGDIARLQTGVTTEGQQPGVEWNPPERGVKLKDQPPSSQRTPAEVPNEDVHPMDRRLVHVNGQQAFDKTVGKPELQIDLLNLEGDQLREVLRKSGEDMTNIQTVGKSAGKAARGGRITDPMNISREEAFAKLFKNGYTPEQIVKEAPPRSKPAPLRKPFGPPRPGIGQIKKD